MNQLEEIKARVERVPQVAPGVDSEEAADALKLIAALEAVEALHYPYDDGVCAECQDVHPCPTLTAITEALK